MITKPLKQPGKQVTELDGEERQSDPVALKKFPSKMVGFEGRSHSAKRSDPLNLLNVRSKNVKDFIPPMDDGICPWSLLPPFGKAKAP